MKELPLLSKTKLVNWQSDTDFAGIEFLGDRQNQEDYSLFTVYNQRRGILVILADGMGGHTSGEIASKLATNSFDVAFKTYPSESVTAKLTASLYQANNDLAKRINNEPNLNGMGSTLIGAYIDKDGLNWISVGDSLLYLFRGRKLWRLNADHSMGSLVDESYRLGKISKQEADNYPNRNALRSAVMGEEITLIDSPKNPMQLYSGDVVIISSDGLQTIDERAIESTVDVMSSSSAKKIALSLLEQVKERNRPKQDNVTIQVIKIPPSFPPPPIKINKYWTLPSLFLIILLLGGYFYDDISLTIVQLIGKGNEKITVIEPTVIPIPSPLKPEVPKSPEPPIVGSFSQDDIVKNKDSKSAKKKSDEKNKGAKLPEVTLGTKQSLEPKVVEGGLGQQSPTPPTKIEKPAVNSKDEEQSSLSQGIKA